MSDIPNVSRQFWHIAAFHWEESPFLHEIRDKSISRILNYKLNLRQISLLSSASFELWFSSIGVKLTYHYYSNELDFCKWILFAWRWFSYSQKIGFIRSFQLPPESAKKGQISNCLSQSRQIKNFILMTFSIVLL